MSEDFDAEDELLNPVENPLENDLVLENLAKFIDTRDLLRFRLVSRKFHLYSLPRLRSCFQVRLDQAALGRYSSLSNFLSLLLSAPPSLGANSSPFSALLLLNLPLSNPLLLKIISFLGPQLSCLRIQRTGPNPLTLLELHSLREFLVHKAPNLVSLSLDVRGQLPERILDLWDPPSLTGCHCGNSSRVILPSLQELHLDSGFGKVHPQLVQDLLQGCPNIRSLTCRKSLVPWGELRRPLSGTSLSVRTLKGLHLQSLDKEGLNLLLRERLNLSHFSCQVLDSVTKEQLQDLLDLGKETLESLSLGEVRNSQERTVRLTLPRMKSLRKLSRSFLCKPQILFGRITYSQQTPLLEELLLEGFSDELDWTEVFSEGNLLYPSSTLTRLSLPSHLRDPGQLLRLGRMFPNIRSLNLPNPTNPVVSVLWGVWADLRELSLALGERNEGIDSIFTGIPQGVCELLGLAGNNRGLDLDQFEGVRVGGCVADLRELRKLHIETAPALWRTEWEGNLLLRRCGDLFPEPSCFLTDITGYFGLAFLHNLEDVCISCCEISDECCTYLAQKAFRKNAKIFISATNHVPVYEFDEFQLQKWPDYELY